MPRVFYVSLPGGWVYVRTIRTGPGVVARRGLPSGVETMPEFTLPLKIGEHLSKIGDMSGRGGRRAGVGYKLILH